MKLSFYGGVNEIGGNKFLAYRDTQVFLDFGKSFERENKFFDFPLLQPFYSSDLKKIIEEANPEILVPVHTEHLELMAGMAQRAVKEIRIPRFQGTIEV